MKPLAQIKPVIEEKLESMGLDLYDIKLISAGSKSILRVFIDKTDGVSISDCENASHELSVLLDVEEFSSQPYTLEISSPGADRPLTRERDFRRNIGRVVKVHLKEPIDSNDSFRGRILSCENGIVLLELKDNDSVAISLENVLSGKIELQFK